MNINVETLKKSVLAKGYTWFNSEPNIIGIRTTLQAPDVFNDLMCCVWKEKDVDTLKVWAVTTDPGVYWLNHPMNKNGAGVLKPGQYIHAYGIGFHKNDQKHRALVQIKPVTVYRDSDLDNLAEEGGKEETGLFGLNIHRAGVTTPSKFIGKWSAGCQVHPVDTTLAQLLWVCDKYKETVHNQFTYTLLREKELI